MCDMTNIRIIEKARWKLDYSKKKMTELLGISLSTYDKWYNLQSIPKDKYVEIAEKALTLFNEMCEPSALRKKVLEELDQDYVYRGYCIRCKEWEVKGTKEHCESVRKMHNFDCRIKWLKDLTSPVTINR